MKKVLLSFMMVFLPFLCLGGGIYQFSLEENPHRFVNAIEHNELTLIKGLIVRKADLNKKHDKEGYTLLMNAIAMNKKEAIEMLLEAGALLSDVPAIHSFLKAVVLGDEEVVSRSINQGMKVAVKGYAGFTPLMCASSLGHTSLVKFLLSRKASVNMTNNAKKTALMYAAQNDHKEIVMLLLEAGAAINAATDSGETALACARNNNHIEMVQKLIKAGAFVDIQFTHGNTVLTAAVGDKQFEIVNALIDAGVDVNETDKNGITPLMWAVKKGCMPLVLLLLHAGADLQKVDTMGHNAVSLAIQLGYESLAHELIRKAQEQGKDLRTTIKGGWTPFMLAAEKGLVSVALKLKELGMAHFSALNEHGETALGIALTRNHKEFVKAFINEKGVANEAAFSNSNTLLTGAAGLGDVDMIETLIKAGAEVTRPGHEGYTPLMYAAHGGHVPAIIKLLDAGASIDAKAKSGETALAIAAEKNWLAVVKELIARGASVEVQFTNDNTVLTAAAEEGYLELVDTLIKAGADVNKAGQEGWTPLMRAAREGHLAVAIRLLDAGANVHVKTSKNSSAFSAAIRSRNKLLVEELIRRGINVHDYPASLNIAAEVGAEDIVEVLLSHGVNANQLSLAGKLPLVTASRSGFKNIVVRLISNRADVNAVNDVGETAIVAAAQGKHREIAEELLKHQVHQLPLALIKAASVGDPVLVGKFIRLTKPSKEILESSVFEIKHLPRLVDRYRAQTALKLIQLCQNPELQEYLQKPLECVRTFLEQLKFGKFKLNRLKQTPITWSCMLGQIELIKRFVNVFAKVPQAKKQRIFNIQDAQEQRTPLMYAILYEHDAIALELLPYCGSGINLRDKENHTALYYAVKFGDYKLVDKLLYYGAKFANTDECILALQVAAHKNIEIFRRIFNIVSQSFKEVTGGALVFKS